MAELDIPRITPLHRPCLADPTVPAPSTPYMCFPCSGNQLAQPKQHEVKHDQQILILSHSHTNASTVLAAAPPEGLPTPELAAVGRRRTRDGPRLHLPPQNAGEPRLAPPLSFVVLSHLSVPFLAAMVAERPWRRPSSPPSSRSPSNSSGSGRIQTPAPRSRPPRLAWVIGHRDAVISLTGSSATAGWPLSHLEETPTHRHLPTRAAAANASSRSLRLRLFKKSF